MTKTAIETKDGVILAAFDDNGLEIYHGNKPLMRFEKSGNVFIEGVLVSNNRKVVFGVREFIKNVESGNYREKEIK